LCLCFFLTEHHAMKAYWGLRYSSTHSLTSAPDGGKRSASRPARFIPRERAPGAHWIGGCNLISPTENWNRRCVYTVKRKTRYFHGSVPLGKLTVVQYLDKLKTKDGYQELDPAFSVHCKPASSYSSSNVCYQRK